MAKLISMKPIVGTACVLMAVVLSPAVASADEDPPPLPPPAAVQHPSLTPDTLHLRSGDIVRGRVTELIAGDHVAIVTPNGETRWVPWSDVGNLVLTTSSFPRRMPAPVPPPAPPRAPAPVSPPREEGPSAFVHIASSGTAYLYRAPEGSTDYVTVCESPCNMELPLAGSYKIGGNGLTTTPAFHLEASPGGRVQLDVDGANWFAIIGGGALIAAGSVTAYAGLLLASLSGDSTETGTAGLGCLLVGGAAIGLGALAFVRGSTTDVSQSNKTKPSKDAYVRTPVWHSATASEQGRAAPATFPVLFERRF